MSDGFVVLTPDSQRNLHRPPALSDTSNTSFNSPASQVSAGKHIHVQKGIVPTQNATPDTNNITATASAANTNQVSLLPHHHQQHHHQQQPQPQQQPQHPRQDSLYFSDTSAPSTQPTASTAAAASVHNENHRYICDNTSPAAPNKDPYIPTLTVSSFGNSDSSTNVTTKSATPSPVSRKTLAESSPTRSPPTTLTPTQKSSTGLAFISSAADPCKPSSQPTPSLTQELVHTISKVSSTQSTVSQSISRNPSSDDEITNRDTNISLRSMSSVATSFESVPDPLAEVSNSVPSNGSRIPSASSTKYGRKHNASSNNSNDNGAYLLDISTVKFDSFSSNNINNTTVAATQDSFNSTVINPASTPPSDIYEDFPKQRNPTFVSPGNSNSTTTAGSSNNDSFSFSTSTPESPVSSAIHEDRENTPRQERQDFENSSVTASNSAATATYNFTPGHSFENSNGSSYTSNVPSSSLINDANNFPLPDEPGPVHALKNRKSCASLASNSSNSISLNHKASSSSFSKSFSRPRSVSSRPPSLHNEPVPTNIPNPNEPLGIAIDRPPDSLAYSSNTSTADSSNTFIAQAVSRNSYISGAQHVPPTPSPLTYSDTTYIPPQPVDAAPAPPLASSHSINTATNSGVGASINPLISPAQPQSVNGDLSPSQLPTQNQPLSKPSLTLNTTNNTANPSSSKRASLRSSTTLPQAPGSRSSTNEFLDVKATGSQRTHSMTFMRRRSLPPQSIASAPAEERADYYREQVKAMRELKRRRQEFEEDDRVLVGKKVSEGHQNYTTAYYMLTGIRVSVSRCNAKVDRELTDEDFTARHKLAFDISGNELIPSSKYDFKFKDYSPWVFRHLRALFKLDPADYLMSLTSKYILSELSSPGKSGSFFYFSRDFRFIIKTIHHSEHRMLRKILKEYYNHITANPNTLISQFYGLHRIKLPWGKKVHFIVMNNLFPPYYDMHRTYDLKGSTLGREHIFKPGEEGTTTAVLKDLNWVAKKENLILGPHKAKIFLEQLERDVELLKRLNIMDYSLLIGIHDLNKTAPARQSVYVVEPGHGENLKGKELRKAVNTASPTVMSALDIGDYRYGNKNLVFYADRGGFQATDENDEPLPEIYFLGVIDCLTPYTFVKRVETFWKGLSYERITISAIPAVEYGSRFYNFMKSTIQDHRLDSGTKSRAPETIPETSTPAESSEAGPSRPPQQLNEAAAPESRPYLTLETPDSQPLMTNNDR